MVIAINTVFFSGKNEYDFLKKVLKSIVTSYPEHKFLLICTEETGLAPAANVTEMNLGLPPVSINRWFFWTYFKIKKILKEHQPQVLINNGEALFHFQKTPQIIFNPDLRFNYDPKSTKAGVRRIFELFAPRYYQKVKSVIVLSSFEKNILIKKLRVEERKINIIQYGSQKEIKPVKYEERERIKDLYAKGFEYFLCMGTAGNNEPLIQLLKSFSAFKKRQKSRMQLLIMWPKDISFEHFKKTLDLYKYKVDVHIIVETDQDQLHKITSAAYGLLFSYRFDKRSHVLLTALKFEVPSIIPNAGGLVEAGRDAVLLYEPGNISDLAGKMMHLFKDEKARKKLIENGKAWINETSFETGIRKTMNLIEAIQE